jgi:TM2 domain-containing membrane protein YozV
MYRLLFIGFFLFLSCKLYPGDNGFSVSLTQSDHSTYSADKKPSPAWFNFFRKQRERKKLVASLLAFPFPGGILGLHRIYLGTKPYVPLIYIVTLGGGFFLLPMIDFFVLLFNKDISRFENHPGVFMWVDNEKKPKEKKQETK